MNLQSIAIVLDLSCPALSAVVRFTPLAVVVLLSFARGAPLRLDFALVIGISFGCAATIAATTEAHLAKKPAGGQDSEAQPAPRTRHSTALSARKSQSFLDNLTAGENILSIQGWGACRADQCPLSG